MTSAVLANAFSDAINSATEWLTDISANWWFLLIILTIALLDSVIPIVPGETTVIIGGVAAGQGEQYLILVIAAGAVGAFIGDNMAYLIGDKMSDSMQRYAKSRPKRQAQLDWASDQIHVRGGMLLITARFIPGGRTILTITSGITRQPRVWFVKWVAIAATIWASYAALLGYIGGKAFQDNHTIAFVVAFGAALAMTAIIEIVRHFRNKHIAGRDSSSST